MNELTRIARRLGRETGAMRFAEPVAHIYNPLDYAWRPHRAYLEKFGAAAPREVLLVGMNPGPWGMAQTGVPFGDVAAVRDWMGVEAKVNKPADEHHKVVIKGFASNRREVSGQRVWAWAAERFGSADDFFDRFMVMNYCPLCFLEAGGRNRTPDKLSREERDELYAYCDRALRDTIEVLRPRFVIGIGKFAETRIRSAAVGTQVVIGSVLHPSPASPMANRGWAPQMDAGLRALGVSVPEPLV